MIVVRTTKAVMHIVQQLFWLAIRALLLPWTLLGRAGQVKESYASFDHLALNVKRPETEWLNMGDWTDADGLPTACRQLAQRLYRTADVRPGMDILDVGHGCGDSLLLLLEQHSPCILDGVTSMPAHAARADSRVKRWQKMHCDAGQRRADVTVYCEDAVRHVERQAAKQNGQQKYDYIFALDCAYHFRTRRRFLVACSALLKPGGTLALADLIAAHPYPGSLPAAQPDPRFTPSPIPAPRQEHASRLDAVKHAFVLRMADVPAQNILPAHVYLDHLDQAGLHLAAMHDISHAVFPAFARFLRQLGKGEEAAWRGGGTVQWMALRAFGNTVHGWAQGGDHGMVRSVLVTARRPMQASASA